MLQSIPGRVAAIFGVLAAAAVLTFAALAHRGPAPTTPPAMPPVPAVAAAPELSGQNLFDRHCGACHAIRDLTQALRHAPDRYEFRRKTIEFLRKHGNASDEDDVRIVDFLLQASGG